MKSNHKEIVTISFDVELNYETPAGRDYLIKNLLRNDTKVDMGGGGDCGHYSMKNVPNTGKVELTGQLFPIHTMSEVDKNDVLIGKTHWSHDANVTLCGEKTDMRWTVLSNNRNGVANCKKCWEVYKETYK